MRVCVYAPLAINNQSHDFEFVIITLKFLWLNFQLQFMALAFDAMDERVSSSKMRHQLQPNKSKITLC